MLTLLKPSRALMPFRQAMLSDPATTAYNAPYLPPDGCISFPEDTWNGWLEDWTAHEPERFAGYLADEQGNLVGEVSWHDFGRDMGIVIKAKYRGRGYGREGLRLLTEEAFRHAEITELRNTFEPDRAAALALHLHAGFVPLSQQDGLLTLRLTRERFEQKRRERFLRLVTDAMCDWDAGDSLRIHHFLKVHAFARQIGLAEGLDENTLFTLEAAALTHDIGIKPAEKQYGSCEGLLQERLGPPEAEAMLTALGLPAPVIRRVSFLIGHHHTTQGVAGIDWQILLEADFLVNMIEGHSSAQAIDTFRDKVFRTREGKRLLQWVRPQGE